MPRLAIAVTVLLAAIASTPSSVPSADAAAPELPPRDPAVRGETLRVAPGVRLYHVLARAADPDAPLLLYLAGGPGASSLGPVFVGNGPWRLEDPFASGRPRVRANPWSFHRLAHVVYLDQPRHTGFSRGRAPYVTTLRAAGRDAIAWLRAFDRRHPELADRPLILAGESFAGTYLSELTRRLLAGEGGAHRLAGVFLEAPSLGRTDAAPARTEVDALCAMGLAPTTACDPRTPGSLAALLARCADRLPGRATIAAVTRARARACRALRAELTLAPTRTGLLRFGRGPRVPAALRGVRVPMPLDGLTFPAGGLVRRHLGFSPNPYDVRVACRPSGGFPPWCYDQRKLTALLDAPRTRDWLGGGIPPRRAWRFADFAVSVALSFRERPPSNAPYAEALRRGVPVTVVFGARDWVVNPVTGRWLAARIAAAAGGPSLPLVDAGAVAGTVATAGPLTVAELAEAGHLVGHDQPATTFRLLERLIAASRPAR